MNIIFIQNTGIWEEQNSVNYYNLYLNIFIILLMIGTSALSAKILRTLIHPAYVLLLLNWLLKNLTLKQGPYKVNSNWYWMCSVFNYNPNHSEHGVALWTSRFRIQHPNAVKTKLHSCKVEMLQELYVEVWVLDPNIQGSLQKEQQIHRLCRICCRELEHC